jgi:hypothetical protein
LYADRWDISSFPGSFVFYSILMEITGINSINVIGAFMAIIYTIVLASIIMLLASFSLKTWRINEGFALMIALQLLPFLTRYAPRPEFPFRFHLTFLQSLLHLALFITLVKNSITRIGTVICLALVYASIVLGHPYFSLYIFVASLSYMAVSYILTRFNVTNRARSITMLSLISVVITFLVHLSYVTAAPLLRQAYSLVFRSEEMPKIFESSIPISITSQSVTVQSLAMIIRLLWRATVLITIFYVIILILLILTRRRIPVLGVSLGVASIVISVPLIVSLLWRGRSLIFVGMALVVAEYETLYTLLEKGLSKSLLTTFRNI